MNQDISEKPVIIEISQGQGVITLNRPQALNALSAPMVEAIARQLDEWQTDPAVESVLFKAAGGRAFCAGGDMKAVYFDLEAGRNPVEYFRAEYRLNRTIFQYPKPTVAVMDGIVMGGGYGIAGHCRRRIVTEKTIFAMPECNIGFFPDVGSMHRLTRAPSHIGRYLALTGNRLNANEMVYAGLADEGAQPQSGRLKIDKIEKIFAFEDLEEIFLALKTDGSAWSEDVFKTLSEKSPLSLAVANEHYNRARGRNFESIIETDFLLAGKFLESQDLKEGIRAVLIDKDNRPRWSESPGKQAVAAYFKPSDLSL